jgi:PKD repeat protein
MKYKSKINSPWRLFMLVTSMLVLISMILPSAAAVKAAGPGATLYGATGAAGTLSVLYTIDKTTGVGTAIGPIGFNVSGIAFDPITGILYGLSGRREAGPAELITIDTTTGAGTLVGTVTDPVRGFLTEAFPDITFDAAGQLYAWSELCDCLVKINKATAAVTFAGPFVPSATTGLAFSHAGRLFMLQAGSVLHTIDPVTGASIHSLVYSGTNMGVGMDFDENDVLYALERLNSGPARAHNLVQVNITNGAITTIGATVPGLDALAFQIQKNQPPTANAGGHYQGEEGSAIAMSGASASDPDVSDTPTFSWSVDSALCSFDFPNILNPDLTCSDSGNYTATLEVSDGTETDSSDASVTVDNVAPTLAAISIDQALVPMNTAINASASFTDPGTLDTHTAVWDWGDDGTTAGTVTQGAGSGSVNDSHSYSMPGVYTLKLIVADNDGAPSSESIYQFVVVYDPSGGFVTGGGWINSPAGAYVADPALTGKANFGFVAKYKMGANVPDGNTEFQFKAGDLNFHSSSYQWLVVAGKKAQFKGEGTINGAGHYGFMLTAIDGQISGGDGVDKFRIKIWDMDNSDAIVYDNQMAGGDGDDPTTVLGGGSIVIHK